jgi:hypothetical protein
VVGKIACEDGVSGEIDFVVDSEFELKTFVRTVEVLGDDDRTFGLVYAASRDLGRRVRGAHHPRKEESEQNCYAAKTAGRSGNTLHRKTLTQIH